MLTNLPEDSPKYAWAEVYDFLPNDGSLDVRLLQIDGSQIVLNFTIQKERKGKLFSSKKTSDSKYILKLLRPK